MHPAQFRRLGADVEPRLDQLLVVPLARAQHHPVLAERHRLPVAICREVADGQHIHRG
jgi:hypothetical protein